MSNNAQPTDLNARFLDIMARVFGLAVIQEGDYKLKLLNHRNQIVKVKRYELPPTIADRVAFMEIEGRKLEKKGMLRELDAEERTAFLKLLEGYMSGN